MDKLTISAYLSRHERLLKQVIEQAHIPSKRIKDAILYTTFPGGKRFRPLLVYLCGHLVKTPIECLDYIAVAIELTHCYSLVHDDLPAMDNDNLRRGKPSCHRAFDEATAILVGDGMQALAVDVLLTYLPLSAEKILAVTKALVKASGVEGMVSGQSLDLSELTQSISEQQLIKIHSLKTGKLINACIHMVLAAGHPTEEEAQALRYFSEHLGIAFQMQDDYLDQYHYELLGKHRPSDADNQKTTFVSFYEKTALRDKIAIYYQNILQNMSVFAEKGDDLRKLIHTLQQRAALEAIPVPTH